MNKLFVDTLQNVKDFGFKNFEVEVDVETNRMIAKSLDDYLWLIDFDNSIDYLEENGIETTNLIVNELSDYIYLRDQLKFEIMTIDEVKKYYY